MNPRHWHWPPRQTWRDRGLEISRVVRGGWATGRPWAGLLVMSVATPVIFVMSLTNPDANRVIGVALVATILGLLAKCLDVRIVNRQRWRSVLEDAELAAVLQRHSLSQSPVEALPRDLLAMEHLDERPVKGRPEPLTSYSDPTGSLHIVVIGVRAGDSNWDIVAARRGSVQQRSFRIRPKLRSSSKPVEELSDLYQVRPRTECVPERLEKWLTTERPLVEIDIRGAWATCRLAAGGSLAQVFSRSIPRVSPVDLETLLVSVDSASRAVEPRQS